MKTLKLLTLTLSIAHFGSALAAEVSYPELPSFECAPSSDKSGPQIEIRPGYTVKDGENILTTMKYSIYWPRDPKEVYVVKSSKNQLINIGKGDDHMILLNAEDKPKGFSRQVLIYLNVKQPGDVATSDSGFIDRGKALALTCSVHEN